MAIFVCHICLNFYRIYSLTSKRVRIWKYATKTTLEHFRGVSYAFKSWDFEGYLKITLAGLGRWEQVLK